MKHKRDSRRPDQAAAGSAAAPGGDGANEIKDSGPDQSGAPRSWKQYIEQTMPSREQIERQNAPLQPPQAPQAAPDVKREARAALNRFAQWMDQLEERAENRAERRAQIKTAREAAAEQRARLKAEREAGKKAAANARAARRAADPAANACTALARVEDAANGGEKRGGGMTRFWNVVARHPISPLLYATVLAVGIGVLAFKGSYARAYVLEVNGQAVGLVSNEDEANAILGNVETRAASVLGEDFDLDVEVTLSPVYAAPGELSDAAEVEDTLFNEVGAYMDAYAVCVDGEELGYAAGMNELYQLLDEVAQPFIPDNAVRYEFVEDVQVRPVELPSNTQFDLEAVRAELSALRVEEAVYEVKQGDTFNAIAYSLDMEPNDLSVLNPDVKVDQLWVGQELVIRQAVPRLSVRVLASESYEEAIPSPVEYIETEDLYVGDSEVKEQGEDGLARISAQVTYVNNVEMDREIIDTTTLKEATTTYTYTGTTPRPVTASNGYFIWPVRGTLTSYFGGRSLWGSYDFHLGIDIAVPYGTGIKAADGGTVIKAGWNGSYGKLVAIQHDNGMVTYYGHNSSILVSVGEKVYQGQIIALAGSTGNSTGNHCHFEVRVEGTSVNPLNYLS